MDSGQQINTPQQNAPQNVHPPIQLQDSYEVHTSHDYQFTSAPQPHGQLQGEEPLIPTQTQPQNIQVSNTPSHIGQPPVPIPQSHVYVSMPMKAANLAQPVSNGPQPQLQGQPMYIVQGSTRYIPVQSYV